MSAILHSAGTHSNQAEIWRFAKRRCISLDSWSDEALEHTYPVTPECPHSRFS